MMIDSANRKQAYLSVISSLQSCSQLLGVYKCVKSKLSTTANCIIVGLTVVVNKSRSIRDLLPGVFVNNTPTHIKGNTAYHCLMRDSHALNVCEVSMICPRQ